jgi:hypothetical protein
MFLDAFSDGEKHDWNSRSSILDERFKQTNRKIFENDFDPSKPGNLVPQLIEN